MADPGGVGGFPPVGGVGPAGAAGGGDPNAVRIDAIRADEGFAGVTAPAAAGEPWRLTAAEDQPAGGNLVTALLHFGLSYPACVNGDPSDVNWNFQFQKETEGPFEGRPKMQMDQGVAYFVAENTFTFNDSAGDPLTVTVETKIFVSSTNRAEALNLALEGYVGHLSNMFDGGRRREIAEAEKGPGSSPRESKALGELENPHLMNKQTFYKGDHWASSTPSVSTSRIEAKKGEDFMKRLNREPKETFYCFDTENKTWKGPLSDKEKEKLEEEEYDKVVAGYDVRAAQGIPSISPSTREGVLAEAENLFIDQNRLAYWLAGGDAPEVAPPPPPPADAEGGPGWVPPPPPPAEEDIPPLPVPPGGDKLAPSLSPLLADVSPPAQPNPAVAQSVAVNAAANIPPEEGWSFDGVRRFWEVISSPGEGPGASSFLG